ncbi:MAG: hypothetical protein HC859_09125, partial [Bacteroidia bacterium]|nr:hypothetical protein [Bacteroidia bacterium]
MGKLKYYYNPETCQYERAKWKIRDVLGYCAGVIAVGCFMFVGIAAVHNRLTDSPLEKSLRKENRAFARHKDLLTSQIEEVELVLATLAEKDRELYKKLFDEEAMAGDRQRVDRDQLLHATPTGFRKNARELADKSDQLKAQSAQSRQVFGAELHITKEDILALRNV